MYFVQLMRGSFVSYFVIGNTTHALHYTQPYNFMSSTFQKTVIDNVVVIYIYVFNLD